MKSNKSILVIITRMVFSIFICSIALLSEAASGAVEKLNLFSFEQEENSKPSVNLPASQYLFLDSGSIDIKLEGKISDDGFPLPGNPSDPNSNDPNKLSWWWDVVTKPSEANEPVLESTDSNDIAGSAFVYNDPNQIITVDPHVRLNRRGYYEFRLYVSDGEKINHATMGIYLYPSNESSNEYRQKGYLYLSPLPGAEYESAQTKYFLIRFIGISPYDVNNLASFITVTGQKSGNHSGNAKIASDKKTVIFEVTNTFSNNELVTVDLEPIIDSNSGTIEPYSYQFMTTGAMVNQSSPDSSENSENNVSLSNVPVQNPVLLATTGPTIMPNGVSVPSNFPYINITTNDNPDSGYIFLDNRTTGSNSYNVIFDNNGCPIWYLQANDERRDMKVQKNGVLTMLNRTGGNKFDGLDNHYRLITTYRAVNGASTDEHELVVLENGRYFLFGITNISVDLSRDFPDRTGYVSLSHTMIQEFTPEGDLIFQWRGVDHFKLSDADFELNRFPHMNAVAIDDDGQLLLSSRHISEVTKIDLNSGEMIWRLSGYNSDFTFVNDPLNGFRNQHSIRALGNRHYLLFDNGDLHNPPVSRSVEYELDPNKMTATVVWQYPGTTTTALYSWYMGNTQRLPNGNTLINWAVGSLPKLTEVRPDGTKAFEMNWVNGYEAYRVWRCRWNGMSLEPVLKAEAQGDTVTLIFNKFGDPNVDYYRIYCGTSPEPNTLWAVSDTTLASVSGFENSGTYYFRVTAVDVNGTVSGYSNQQSAYVSKSQPGTNMVKNGDFSQGTTNWIWTTPTTPASATYEIKNGAFHYIIDNGGSSWASVQFRQTGINLVQGRYYIFEFDAWADSPRTIEAKVGQEVSPFTNYSTIGPTYITTQKKRYSYGFIMDYATDSNSRVVINTGTSDIDVYIDNISLMYVQF